MYIVVTYTTMTLAETIQLAGFQEKASQEAVYEQWK